MRTALLTLLLASAGLQATAEPYTVSLEPLTEWKSVYGEVESRDRVSARARIGGTIVELLVTEGDMVEAGDLVATIEDDKLGFQIDALNANLASMASQLETALADLTRGEQLLERGVITSQALDAMRTNVDVIRGNIAATEAEKLVVERQIEEGAVLAPETGVVLDVPFSVGSNISPSESIAAIGGGGVFLRLAIPERHTDGLAEGDPILIEGADGEKQGTLVKLYPEITSGRLEADVEVEGLDDRFIGRRVPVRLPVGTREAILIPAAALTTKGGLDFVMVETHSGEIERIVVPGGTITRDGEDFIEILTGLTSGDVVLTNE